MEYSLSSSLVGGSGSINPDGLSLDLNFAADKTLTARKGPTPVLTRASVATYIASDGSLQSAAINAARFDHKNSYDTSYAVLSGSPLDSNGGTVDITSPVLFDSWDSNSPQFPQFIYSGSQLLQIGVNGTNWEVSASDGDFVARRSLNDGISGAYTIISGSGTLTVTLVKPCNGLLIEEQRQNLLLNTNGDLSTQSTTVTAVAHTISFYGTGTIILSGASAATISPAAFYGDLKTYTFTPTAGVLVVAATGSVRYAQLEIGSFATSRILTTSSQLTRSADVCSITGVSTFYNATESTLFAEALVGSASNFNSLISFDNAAASNQLTLAAFPSPNTINNFVVSGGTTSASVSRSLTLGVFFKAASSNKLNAFQLSMNGTNGTLDTSGAMPVGISTFNIGRAWNGAAINGCLKSVKVYKKAMSDAKLQALTTL